MPTNNYLFHKIDR